MHVPDWIWGITLAVVVFLFLFDFFAHVRRPHVPTFRESLGWSIVYVLLACVFGAGVWWVWGSKHGTEFFAGFVMEKSLSVDNLFVFSIILAKFNVPAQAQQKALMIGIVVALLLRGIFIAAGAAAIHQFSWVFYIFGAFLLYTAVKLAIESFSHSDSSSEDDYKPNAVIRFAQRHLPISDTFDGNRVTSRVNGKRVLTPMALVILALGLTDIVFALDSIPAIYGLTQAPYIVFTANVFALLGLLQMFFLLEGLLERLVYLGAGLSLVLAFIGVKLVLEALHENSLPFLNNGEPLTGVPEISTGLSLTVIISVLLVTTVASLWKSKYRQGGEEK
ncbi:TerC/Alx family metal homeostasis membrane protein [Carnimonas nigrificans]|uniref:TerC/Alx family metal homeostasis membrane protein n=1 Tax=Carnimonas nigrificans TaxID=64323 RepID=UPI0004716E4B|nr:TerC/Alx family metal homeostasis membrane protein [Carnimonas nigrificans]